MLVDAVVEVAHPDGMVLGGELAPARVRVRVRVRARVRVRVRVEVRVRVRARVRVSSHMVLPRRVLRRMLRASWLRWITLSWCAAR